MSVEVLLKFGSLTEASAAIALLAGGKPASAAPATTAPSAANGAGAASGKDTKETKETKPKLMKYEETELPALIQRLAKTKREGVMAVLKDFGAAKGAELKPEDFKDAIEKLKALEKEETSDLA